MIGLQTAAGQASDYWDFRKPSEELASRRLFQYPAMMVPALQKEVVTAVLRAHPKTRRLSDPFMGSGTILALAMLNGLEFVGQDINPLSILIAKTRAFSLDAELLDAAVRRVCSRSTADISRSYSVRFCRQEKWFTRGASIGLSRLRNAIQRERSIHARRFLWVCLAETVRLNSNSRTSTYKLHVKPREQRTATTSSVIKSFALIANRNHKIVEEFRTTLKRAGYLTSTSKYNRRVRIYYGDSAASFGATRRGDNSRELAVTSPPYGDNRTTVPYGQAAWLALQWIDLPDISRRIPKDCARGAYDIDNRSLGGRRSRNLVMRCKELANSGAETAASIERLMKASREGLSRFAHFVSDLHRALAVLAARCRSDEYLVITLGDRNIAGTVCPLAIICAEALSALQVREVTRIVRQIPSKRMPEKNRQSATITREYISIFRKSHS